jgi:PEP-CTERM motif-containing protein
MGRVTRHVVISIFLGLFLSLAATSAFADGLTPPAGYTLFASYTESASTGFVSSPIPICCELSGVSLVVASDGESAFDPFNAGFDTSDGIQFQGIDPSLVTSANSAWVAVTDTVGPIWVLPATIPGCGSENEPTCEPTGTFYINQTWTGVPSYIAIYESDGTTLSDIITGDSNGPGGVFELKFYSDSAPVVTPEPGTLALLGSGLAFAGLLRRKKAIS